MITVYRARGLRVVIFVNDHELGARSCVRDGEAKINLAGGGSAPELVWADGVKRSEVRRAMTIVTDMREQLLIRWREIHG